MFAVWKLQTRRRPPQHITVIDLAEALRCPQKTVSTVVRRLAMRQGKHYLTERQAPAADGRGGRAPMSYSLDTERVVTFPETALALLELAKYPRTSPFRIKRDDFERYVSSIFGIPLRFLRGRLNKAIKAGYITVPSYGHIWP